MNPLLRLCVGMLLLTGLAVAQPSSPPAAPAAAATPGEVVYFDASPLAKLNLDDPQQLRRYYDETFLLVSLQAIVNRDRPQLFLRYNTRPDDFWWARMTEAKGWLAGAKVTRIQGTEALLRHFLPAVKGVVIWDERVPATSNLAATLAGVDDLLVLRYDKAPGSLMQQLSARFPQLALRMNFVKADGSPMFTGSGTIPDTTLASSGSAKNDAYRWLIERIIKTGKANPRKLGYYLDGFWLKSHKNSDPQNHTLTNLDYVLAHRGVVFDLNVWDDEACIDDPTQKPGTDLETLKLLMRACYDRFAGKGMIHVAGFTPWAFKYTDFKNEHGGAGGIHGGVETEWRYAEVISCFNGYMDADALAYSSLVNASFFQHYPLPDVIPQSPAPTREALVKSGVLDAQGKLRPVNYYAHFIGDYDAAAWVYWNIPIFWADPARGTLPLSWAINPNLCERFPFGLHWLRSTAKPGEVFMAGEAAGYLNPSLLLAPRPYSGLPDGLDPWVEHNKKFYHQWDIDVTGFSIDGNTPSMPDRVLAAYATFSPGGVAFQRAPKGQGVFNGMPMIQHFGDLPNGTNYRPDGLALDGPHDFDLAAQQIASSCIPERPNFMLFRSILRTPSYYAGIDKRLKEVAPFPTVLVDARTLMWLVREYEEHRDEYAARSPFADAAHVALTAGTPAGIRQVIVPDGRVPLEQVDGTPAWQFKTDPTQAFLYGDVDDGFVLKHKGAAYTVTLTCRATGATRLALHYDSTDQQAPASGSYKETAWQDLPAGTEWRQLTWTLPDAMFANRENGRADLRLTWQGNGLQVRTLKLEPATK